MLLTGRGWGKTRTGAEYVRKMAESGECPRIGLIAKDAMDAREVMIEGDSGILSISPPWFMPHYEPSKKRLTWPNGVRATIFSSEDPDELRGPQHHMIWADEAAKWKYPKDTWDMMLFGLRLGVRPRCVISTTPRPTQQFMRDLLKDPTCCVTYGSTHDNMDNLSEIYKQIIAGYEGTRLGRAEIYGMILDDNPNALWSHSMIGDPVKKPEELVRIVVAIDPSIADEDSDDPAECGIVVVGKDRAGHGYVLEDGSLRAHPAEWARAAIRLYRKYGADRIVAEINNGGAMIEALLRMVERNIPYRKLTATRGKLTRAEPVAALYEQGKVSHCGQFVTLEEQMCSYEADPSQPSPDRMDALVWGLTDLYCIGELARARHGGSTR